jgi:hypothetical protein
MEAIESISELQTLLQNRPDKTTTYRVTFDFTDQIPRESGALPLREMTAAEVRELEEYLGAGFGTLIRPLRVVEASCPRCDRVRTVLDYVKTAVDSGRHSKRDLERVLTGNNGFWITVRGRDGGRPVVCAECELPAFLREDGGYSEYSGGSYAYA